MLSGVRRPEPAWPLGALGRLLFSPLLCTNNNMLLPQLGCAAGTALAGTVHTFMGMLYQGLVAGGNLLAEGRSGALAGLATTRRPPPAAALPTAL